MEFILITLLLAMLIFIGIRKLLEWSKAGEQALAEQPQQILFMSEALTVSDDLIHALSSKMDLRSLEIAKADGRFLITPEDMKQAYQEIIREDLM